MNTELVIAIASVIGAIISMIAALASFRREEIKASLEKRSVKMAEDERRKAIATSVAEDTVGLYRRLSEQYAALTKKDKELLRTITFVIRHLIILKRTVTDFLAEMDNRWDIHEGEAHDIDCPFYADMTEYMYLRIKGIEDIIHETMDEIDTLLQNGNGNADHKH